MTGSASFAHEITSVTVECTKGRNQMKLCVVSTFDCTTEELTYVDLPRKLNK